MLALVQAAAKASNQTISSSLLRLLGKLALQAEKGGALMRAGASAAMRDQVEQLVDNWDTRRLNPEGYQEALDRMAQRRVFTLMLQRQHPCEPKRLVATALETDTLGGPVWLAVNQLISHGGIAMLLDLLDRAPANNKTAEELWPLVATPDNLRHLLREEQIDPALLERISTRMGLDVVELLLDGLETSETRTMRRKLLDLLARFGNDAGPMIVKRLNNEDIPWYVQRNLLTLLVLLPKVPDGFSPQLFLTHSDERVRREALKLMLRMPEHRHDDDHRRALRPRRRHREDRDGGCARRLSEGGAAADHAQRGAALRASGDARARHSRHRRRARRGVARVAARLRREERRRCCVA